MANRGKSSPFLAAQIEGGASEPIQPQPSGHANAGEVTLAQNTTYYIPFGDDGATLESVQLVHDAAIVVTFTVELTNYPKEDAPNHSANTDKRWTQENPSSAVVSSTGGITWTALSGVTAGTTRGSSVIHIGNLGTKRGRVKAVVAGVGGNVAALGHQKD